MWYPVTPESGWSEVRAPEENTSSGLGVMAADRKENLLRKAGAITKSSA